MALFPRGFLNASQPCLLFIQEAGGQTQLHRGLFYMLLTLSARGDVPNERFSSFPLSAVTLLCCVKKKEEKLIFWVSTKKKTHTAKESCEKYYNIISPSVTRSSGKKMDEFHSPVKFPIHRRCSPSLVGCRGCRCQAVRAGSQWEARRLTQPPAGHNHLFACYGAAWCQLPQTGRS